MEPSTPWAGPVTISGSGVSRTNDGGSGASVHGRRIVTNPLNATDAVRFEHAGGGLRVQSGLPSNRPAASVTAVSPAPLEVRSTITPAPKAPRTNAMLVPSGDQEHS